MILSFFFFFFVIEKLSCSLTFSLMELQRKELQAVSPSRLACLPRRFCWSSAGSGGASSIEVVRPCFAGGRVRRATATTLGFLLLIEPRSME